MNHRFKDKVVVVNERNTTKCCHLCQTETQKFFTYKKKEDRETLGSVHETRVPNGREIHGLRRCQNVLCKVWLNRDYNAAINIRNKLEQELWDALNALLPEWEDAMEIAN